MYTILIVFAVLLAAFLLYAASKPNTFRFERSIVVNAPPEKIFPLVNDFRAWTKWSPWEKLDADLKRDYAGAASGVGATYAWLGDKSGQGRMEIVESTPSSKIGIKLDFIKPMQASNKAEFSFIPEAGGGTRVNWVMTGQNPYMAKVMQTVISMDSFLAKDFESGLAAMKAAAEQN